MEIEHFLALLPLMILLIMSFLWRYKGAVHIFTFAYTLVLAWLAFWGSWELIFWPVCIGSGIVSITLFIIAMSEGEWI